MEVIFLLIFFSLVVALTFLYLLFWAVKSGQYDDSETPAMRILFDSENSKTNNTNRDGQ